MTVSPPHCLLRHLENPQLGGLLFGLDPKNRYALRDDYVKCCGGRGISWDEKRQANLSCEVRIRHRKTLELIKQYSQFWGRSMIPLPNGGANYKLLSKVADVLKGCAPQAHVFPTESNKPGVLWGVACALTWRFGVNVHMVSMSRKGSTIQVPSEEVMKSSRPLVIICEQVKRLTDPHDRTQLESLIQIAYQSNAFLWVEVMTQRPAQRNVNGAETLMARREREKVNALRKKPVMELLRDHLSSDTMSQLSSLCQLPRMSPHRLGVEDGLLSLD